MNAMIQTALNKSIAHWEENLKAIEEYIKGNISFGAFCITFSISIDSCALCRMFF